MNSDLRSFRPRTRLIDRYGENRRRGIRFPVRFRPVEILSGHYSGSGLIMDISSGGMRVMVSDPHEVGEEVTILLSDGDALEGHIIWSIGLRVGIELHDDCDVDRIRRTLRA